MTLLDHEDRQGPPGNRDNRQKWCPPFIDGNPWRLSPRIKNGGISGYVREFFAGGWTGIQDAWCERGRQSSPQGTADETVGLTNVTAAGLAGAPGGAANGR